MIRAYLRDAFTLIAGGTGLTALVLLAGALMGAL